METIQNQNANQEEAFLYGNFVADGHGFIVQADPDAYADDESGDSIDKTMSRVGRKGPGTWRKDRDGKLRNWTLEKAQTLSERWFDEILSEKNLSQEEMLVELDNHFEAAEARDAKDFPVVLWPTMEQQKEYAALRAAARSALELETVEAFIAAGNPNITAFARRAVRNVARGLVHDMIVDHCGQEFYSAEHPVIESFADIHSQERGSDAWLPEPDPSRDNWREPPSQARYLDNKIAKAKARVYSPACLDLLAWIRSDKWIHLAGKMIHATVNPKDSASPFTRCEQDIIWATWKGFAPLRKASDLAYGLIEKIRAGKINGRDLYQATQSLTPFDKDRVWFAWRRANTQVE